MVALPTRRLSRAALAAHVGRYRRLRRARDYPSATADARAVTCHYLDTRGAADARTQAWARRLLHCRLIEAADAVPPLQIGLDL